MFELRLVNGYGCFSFHALWLFDGAKGGEKRGLGA